MCIKYRMRQWAMGLVRISKHVSKSVRVVAPEKNIVHFKIKNNGAATKIFIKDILENLSN